MKTLIPLVTAVTLCSFAKAEDLTDADREALLERLEQLRSDADSRVDARFRVAIAAYRSAMSSEDQTYQLYMKCVEKVNFEDQKRKAADFREWKRNEDEKNKDPAFRKALRYQLRWLVLTLQAASANADRSQLASNAMEITDSLFNEAKSLAGQEGLLRQGVTSSVFARAYDIGNVRVEKWANSPAQIDQVYDQILLPPHRLTRNASGLRSGWTKRIQHELTAKEFWVERRDNNERSNRIGMADAMRPPEYDKFLADEVPKLQWQMETDLFKYGDQSGAAIRMLAHLDKHITHPSAIEWGEQLTALLKPGAAPVAPVDGEANLEL